MTQKSEINCTGRLSCPPGFVPRPWKGMGTREGRLYLLMSVASQPNPDQAKAQALLTRLGHKGRRS